MQLATGVDQDHVARFKGFGLGDPVGKRAIRPEQHDAEIRPRRGAYPLVRLMDEPGYLASGDAGAQDPGHRAVDFQGHVLGALHQRQLCLRLMHAAACGDRRRTLDAAGRRGLPQAIDNEERRGFVHSQRLHLQVGQ